MAIVRTIAVGDQEVRMRASALTPRFYRVKFGRDMMTDMQRLQKSFNSVLKEEQENLSINDLTVFENVAYIMAWHADNSIPEDPDEWLDGFDGVFSVYEALPQILELWGINTATTAVPRKK